MWKTWAAPVSKKFLINPFEEAERQAVERGNWVVATVDPRMSWPTKRQIVVFDQKDFVLFPQGGDSDQTAGVALRADRYRLNAAAARKEIMRFCSALSWHERAGLAVVAWGGGNLPRPIGVRLGRVVTNFLEARQLPIANTNEERAALALYREGVSLDNPFYAFLSLYKAISVVIPKGKERGAWIEDALNRLDDRRAKERREALRSDGSNIGLYLWNECRNAIAHAEKQPYVIPDDVDDHFRLTKDIPLLRNLAELAIEERTGLRRSHTLWREHLYELAGFKALLPEAIVKALAESEPLPEGTSVEMPELYTIVARRGPETISFENMRPRIIGQIPGGMVLDFVTDDEAVKIRTELSFADERLRFDPVNGIGFVPNRDDPTFVRHEISVLHFSRCILSNGHLEVWNQEDEAMLGRSETCIPVNCFVNEEFYKTELRKLDALLGG